jgi:hypothetical protein
VSDTRTRGTRLEITVVGGGHPDTATLAAIEEAVRGARSDAGALATAAAPAWLRAARLEGTGRPRIVSLTGLAAGVRG